MFFLQFSSNNWNRRAVVNTWLIRRWGRGGGDEMLRHKSFFKGKKNICRVWNFLNLIIIPKIRWKISSLKETSGATSQRADLDVYFKRNARQSGRVTTAEEFIFGCWNQCRHERPISRFGFIATDDKWFFFHSNLEVKDFLKLAFSSLGEGTLLNDIPCEVFDRSIIVYSCANPWLITNLTTVRDVRGT